MAERQQTAEEKKQDREHDGQGCEHAHGHGGGSAIPSYTVTELRVKEEILAKARELAGMIYSSEEVQHFRRAEEQIKANDRIQTLIAAIKKKQKEIVAFESFGNEAMVKKIEGEIEALQDELDGIPIVSDFQQSQSDINYLLQLVVSVIRDTVAEKIELDGSDSAEPEDGYGE